MSRHVRATAPGPTEAASYYFKYIDRVRESDIVHFLETQQQELVDFLSGISEEKSQTRYEPGKWSIRQVLSHINDSERVFAHRAFWFARGFDSPLPSYDQEIAAREAAADERSWRSHVDEFRNIRTSTLDLFRDLPEDAWLREGVASDVPFTVRALAFIIAGHAIHHTDVIKQRYLNVAGA